MNFNNRKPVAIRLRLGVTDVQQTDIEIIYIAEAAKMLGIKKETLRMRVYRQVWLGIDQDLPRPFQMLGKWAWKRADLIEHINRKAQDGGE